MAEADSIHPLVAGMAVVHETFTSSFNDAPAFIESTVGDDYRRELIADFYTNVLASLEGHHHGEEELVFPLLMERAPEHREVVDLGMEQHEQVLPLLEAVKTAIETWESKGDAGGPELVRALRCLNEALTPHHDYEEATIVPLVAEHVTPEEWYTLRAQTPEQFKGDKPWLILGLALEVVTPEQRVTYSENLSPQMREWWDTEGEPSFEKMIVEVRQTH